MPILGLIDSAKTGNLAGYLAYEFIASSAPSGTNTVTFSSIPATYKNLRLHVTGRSDYTAYDLHGYLRFNNDTGNNYRGRYTLSNGSPPLYVQNNGGSFTLAIPDFPGSYIDSNDFASGICEIHDYTDTSQITIVTGFGGYSTGGFGQSSGYWNNTAVINRIDLVLSTGNWVSGSRFALYGIKG
jgi:hypothetical protein